jgi:competence protein ComEC
VPSSRDPLVLPLVAFMCGLGAARFASFHPIELGAGIAALLALWIGARWKARRVSIAAGFACLMLVGCAVAEYQRPQARPELTSNDNETLIVGGCVVEPAPSDPHVSRFVVELEPHTRMRVTLTARDGDTLPAITYGNLVEVEARVRKPVNFGNPGAFDFAGYLARQDIYWTASARGADKLQMVAGQCGSGWHKAWFAARRWALQRVEHLFEGDSYTIAMMSGMLLGDAHAIERSWTEEFRRTGTYHTLVISGLHITVLAGALLVILRLCFVPLGIRLLLCAGAAWGYAMLTGMQTPVARSAAGFTLFLIASFYYRPGRILNLLAAVAFVFLIVDPDQLADASFQLSFLAVAAIGAFGAPLLETTSLPVLKAVSGLNDPGRDAALPERVAALRVEFRLLAETFALWTRMPKKFAASGLSALVQGLIHVYELILISAAIQIVLVLPSVAYFHRLSWTSLTANAVVVPALSAAVPFGFLAILTGWSAPAAVADALLQVSRYVVEWHARLEPNWRIPSVPLLLQVGFAVALVAAGVAIYRVYRWRAAVLTAVLVIVVVIYAHPFAAVRQAGRLELTSIDVGQGDSHLVVAPDGKTLLVDGGGIPVFDPKYKPKLEIGEDVVSPYLWTRGIKRIDVVAMTHAHDDHARGVIAIIENFRPRELWTGAQPQTGVWLEILAKAREHGVRISQRCAGEHIEWGGASIDVLAPADGRTGAEAASNNDSLVFQLVFGKHRFLLTGDMERQVESELVASGTLQHVDVLKVAHHGSRTSTTPGLAEILRPAFAVVSAGRNNSYRHPHPDVVERLSGMNTRLLRTDQDGLVTFISDGKRITLETQTWGGDHATIRHPLTGD